MNEENICTYLFDPVGYNPDTLDLNNDADARSYWFQCFNELAKKFAQQAAKSQCSDPTAANRAQAFERNYIDIINSLKTDTQRYVYIVLFKYKINRKNGMSTHTVLLHCFAYKNMSSWSNSINAKQQR